MAGSRGRAAHLRPEPALLGAAPGLPGSHRVSLLASGRARGPARVEVDMICPGARRLQRRGTLELPEPARDHVSSRILRSAAGSTSTSGSAGRPPRARSRLVRQALAYGIDRRDRRDRGHLCPCDPTPGRSTASSSGEQPLLPAELERLRYRPARRGGCSNRPAAAEARTESTCVQKAALAPFRNSRPGRAARRLTQARPAQLRRVGVEVVLRFVPPASRARRSRRATSTSFGSAGSCGARTGAVGLYGCEQPNNYTGYCDGW